MSWVVRMSEVWVSLAFVKECVLWTSELSCHWTMWTLKNQHFEQWTLNSEHVELVLLWLCHHWWHERRLFALRVVYVPQPQPQPQPQVSAIFLGESYSVVCSAGFKNLQNKPTVPYADPILWKLCWNSISASILQTLTFAAFYCS